MIEINPWINTFLKALNETFNERAWFVGLQGSYARGEETETSDIDTVVILDTLSAHDIEIYDTMLDTLPHREMICGFLCGKSELINWEPSDLFQFYHDTKPIKGALDEIFALLDTNAVSRAIKIGACNIFHGCVHNMLYEKSEEALKSLYKSASFVIQAVHFRQTGKYINQQKHLIDAVPPDDREILNIFSCLKSGGAVDFNKMSDALFEWSKNKIDER
ncbi:MAG: nucleotidyltransferase domain-containing protein [Ruminococcaceae bacterium]|nr:nucleotidyltransferase domain-containing protein [Oscillospiraceae bacterium]